MKDRTKQNKKPGRRAVILLAAAAVVLVAAVCVIRYLTGGYEATATAKAALAGNDKVEVTSRDDSYLFSPRESSNVDAGIILYPGGNVDEVAYAPLASRLAECGYQVFLAQVPFDFAVFDSDAAEDIMDANTDIREWILMGHSLGGAMAAKCAAENADRVGGLVLLAAYSTKDLSGSGIKVLSIRGSRDEVLSKERYEKNRKNLPDDRKEYIIEGGNHAGYGYYGKQSGDGEAQISQREQQEEVVDLFLSVFGEAR